MCFLNVSTDRVPRWTPIVVLQPATVAFIEGSAGQVHQAADQMLGNQVDPIALGHTLHVGVAALDTTRVTREQKFKSVRPQEWVPPLRAKPAFPAPEHVTVDKSLKRSAMGANQVSSALGAVRHDRRFC